MGFFFPSRTLAAPPLNLSSAGCLTCGQELLRASEGHPESTEGSALRQAGWGKGGAAPSLAAEKPLETSEQGGHKGKCPAGWRLEPWVPTCPSSPGQVQILPVAPVQIYRALLVAAARLLPRRWLLKDPSLQLRPGSSLRQ